MANDGTSGRRKQTDFQGLTFDNWPKTGAQDRNARAKRGDIQQDNSGFEGSVVETILSPGLQRKADLSTDIN